MEVVKNFQDWPTTLKLNRAIRYANLGSQRTLVSNLAHKLFRGSKQFLRESSEYPIFNQHSKPFSQFLHDWFCAQSSRLLSTFSASHGVSARLNSQRGCIRHPPKQKKSMLFAGSPAFTFTSSPHTCKVKPVNAFTSLSQPVVFLRCYRRRISLSQHDSQHPR